MRAAESLSAIRRGEDSPREPGETLFEAVAKTVMQRYKRVWKPRALYVNRRLSADPAEYRRSRHRRHRPAVRKWFASLRATPVAADRSMPVLSVIMREAEAMGLRPEDSNPGRGIRRYRRKGRERFLSQDELRRLSERLSAHATRFPQQVAVIRPLLLTGCRKGGDLDPALVGLPRGTSLSARQQDRAQNRLVADNGPECSGNAGSDRPVGVPGMQQENAKMRQLATFLSVEGPHGGESVRRAPSRLASQPLAGSHLTSMRYSTAVPPWYRGQMARTETRGGMPSRLSTSIPRKYSISSIFPFSPCQMTLIPLVMMRIPFSFIGREQERLGGFCGAVHEHA